MAAGTCKQYEVCNLDLAQYHLLPIWGLTVSGCWDFERVNGSLVIVGQDECTPALLESGNLRPAMFAVPRRLRGRSIVCDVFCLFFHSIVAAILVWLLKWFCCRCVKLLLIARHLDPAVVLCSSIQLRCALEAGRTEIQRSVVIGWHIVHGRCRWSFTASRQVWVPLYIGGKLHC